MPRVNGTRRVFRAAGDRLSLDEAANPTRTASDVGVRWRGKQGVESEGRASKQASKGGREGERMRVDLQRPLGQLEFPS